MFKRSIESIGNWYCRKFHSGIYWAGTGEYRCKVCLRLHPVPWGTLCK